MADGRLLVNGSFLDQPTTGSGQYLRHLLPRLAQQWDGLVTVLLPGARQNVSGPTVPMNVHVTSAPPPVTGNLGKLWFEQVTVPLAARRLRADVLFVPYFGPPLAQPAPTVVTVHDVIMLAVPEYAGPVLAQAYSRLAAVATRRAVAVLADSLHSRNDAVRLAGIAPERITVAPLAAELTPWPGGMEQVAADLHALYGLEPGYIFSAGGLDRRKDVGTLLRAYALLDNPPPLVIAGQPRSDHPARFPDLRALAAELAIAEHVRLLGWVPEDHKPLLYAGAGVFAFTSRYEGFGLTPLEAMACGAPVVCSDASSLPEVVGDGGLLYPAGDVRALAAALRRVLTDAALREHLRAAGRAQAARFSWEATATATAAVLRKAAHITSTAGTAVRP